MLVPVVVRNDGDAFELVAGFHRIAAARTLGLAEVPVVVRDVQTEDADRAVENITRKQLNPYEEAKAVRAMLDRGLTEDGAAQALGWPKTRVTARVKILELPERAQQLIGDDVIHLAAVDQRGQRPDPRGQQPVSKNAGATREPIARRRTPASRPERASAAPRRRRPLPRESRRKNKQLLLRGLLFGFGLSGCPMPRRWCDRVLLAGDEQAAEGPRLRRPVNSTGALRGEAGRG